MIKTFLGIKIDSMELDNNGFLRIKDARVARTGVLRYLSGNEYRDAKEVFSEEHMNSLDGLPLTNDHPPALLNSLTASRYQVGSMSNPRQDSNGTHILADILVTDAKAIREIQNGKSELSMGYVSNDIPNIGVFDGLSYQTEQTALMGNHLAIVKQGRCGSSCRMDNAINLDELDGVTILETKAEKEFSMAKVKIDGVEYEVADNALAKAIGDNMASSTTKVDSAEAQVVAATAERDNLQGKLDATQEELVSAKASKMDADKINEMVQETIITASQALKLDAKFDTTGKTPIDIMRGIVGDKADGKSDDYVRGIFETKVDAMSDEKAGGLNSAGNSDEEEESEDPTRDAFKKKMMDKKREVKSNGTNRI